jgi:outer membrane murein-binding lipoprotein Lpp
VWIGAVVLALVVVAFCTYEIVWKAKRLRTQVTRLAVLTQRMQALQAEVAATQQRAAGTGL